MGTPEPDDAGGDHAVPADLVELHEVLEWGAALNPPTVTEEP